MDEDDQLVSPLGSKNFGLCGDDKAAEVLTMTIRAWTYVVWSY